MAKNYHYCRRVSRRKGRAVKGKAGLFAADRGGTQHSNDAALYTNYVFCGGETQPELLKKLF
jgi:hypothetical protein